MKYLRTANKVRSKIKADPLQALQILRTLGRVWNIWPLDTKASRSRKIYHEFTLWFIIGNLFFLTITLWMAVSTCHRYPVITARNLSQLMIIYDSLTHLICYRMNRTNFWNLLQEIFDFLKACKHHEKLVMKLHYKRFLTLYTTLIVLYTIAALAFFCGSLILEKQFPFDAIYPFSTDSGLVSMIIFTHQTFSIIQNSVIIIIDFLVIALFWYGGARIRLLGCRLRILDSDKQLRQCILEHQDILRYIQSTVWTVRFIVYKTLAIVGIILISEGLELIHDANSVLSECFLIMIVASLRIITYSSTIEEIKELVYLYPHGNLRWTIYKSDWFKTSIRTNKSLALFIHRCQMPVVTVNGCLFNIMTLKFFTKFIYMTVSHLTTLHAVIGRSS